MLACSVASQCALRDLTISPFTVIAFDPRAWFTIGMPHEDPPNPSLPNRAYGIAQRSAMRRSKDPDVLAVAIQSDLDANTRSTAQYMELPPGLAEYTYGSEHFPRLVEELTSSTGTSLGGRDIVEVRHDVRSETTVIC